VAFPTLGTSHTSQVADVPNVEKSEQVASRWKVADPADSVREIICALTADEWADESDELGS
jgi:hypothetical protein